jgi:glyoxylase-like metal-dependent hydrolase (beta-lactamase superfamily II)
MTLTPITITITHLGTETCVTGSCHLVQFQPDHGGRSIAILVDCGIAQGHDPQMPFDQFPVPPTDIDFLFLTHAYIDHIGRVPNLIDELDRINPRGAGVHRFPAGHPNHLAVPGNGPVLGQGSQNPESRRF